MKYIFEEIIKTDNIFLVIEKHFEDDAQRDHVKNVVRDTIHHKLMDLILDELDHEKSVHFLNNVHIEEAHGDLLEKLKAWIENLEEKLHIRTKESEEEIMKLIEV